MAKVLQQYRIAGTNIFAHKTQEGSVVDKIPPGYYKVESHPFMGYYLSKEADTVVVPEKIYGSTTERSQRIWNSFDNTLNPLGVGLFGTKGAGKTLLSNLIAKQAIEDRGLPVIDVSSTFTIESDYLDFLNSLGNVVIIFDEFIKRLGNIRRSSEDNDSARDVARKRQDEMLPFFSGTNNSKRLIIMIDNTTMGLSEFIADRPGRMRYSFNYTGVEESVIRALCKDNSIPDNKTDELVTYATRNLSSFDVVNEIIKEMVLYPNDNLADITKIMNVPSMFVGTSLQAQVLNFDNSKVKHPFIKWQLNNELCVIDSEGSLRVEVHSNNPFKEFNFKNEEEFDEHDISDYYSWTSYQSNKSLEKLTDNFVINRRQLLSMRGTNRVYSSGDYTITVNVMDEVIDRQSFAWLD